MRQRAVPPEDWGQPAVYAQYAQSTLFVLDRR
jgi:hypothetical protein